MRVAAAMAGHSAASLLGGHSGPGAAAGPGSLCFNANPPASGAAARLPQQQR